MGSYYLLVVVFIAIAAGNVIWQVLVPGLTAKPADACKPGLFELARAIDRARDVASVTEGDDEDAAVARFRAALSPEWERRDSIAAACRSRRDFAQALDAIERLRYAEEHAARLDAAELAPLRRKVRELVNRGLDGMH